MKVGKNKPTPEQTRRMDALRSVGHKCVVCYSWEAAQREIMDYLAIGAKAWPEVAA